MSFSYDTKLELARLEISSKCCAISECYGILLYCNTFTANQVKIITENIPFAKRTIKLFRRAFGFTFDQMPENPQEGMKHVLIIEDKDKLDKIFAAYGYERANILAHHINYGILEDECCRQSFMRGAFFAGGSITDPRKRYHLELVTDHYSVSREIYTLLLEMEFEPRNTSRSGNYITYFKQSEAIENFLTTIGAPLAAMEIMQAKIEKEVYNSVNRRVNCDTANVTKTVNAAQEQVDAIKKLAERGILTTLPEKIQSTARLRMENPELSLAQLAELTDPPVTKSCLNHRLRKLTQLANE